MKSAILLLFLLITVSVNAQQALPLPGRASGDGFGQDVAIDGDTAMIGAADGIYIYVRSGTTWTQQGKLEASDGAALQVGDIDGDTAVAIHPAISQFDTERGAVYVFVRSGSTWTEQAKLSTAVSHPNSFLTGPVELDGDLLLVGALGGDPDSLDHVTFQAFSFVRSGSTWTQDYWFGFGLTSSHDLTLSGHDAIFRNNWIETGDYAGDVYFYTRASGSWALVEEWHGGQLSDPNYPSLGGTFEDIERSGDTLVGTGCLYDLWCIYDVIYVFTRSGATWSRQAILHPTNSQGHPYDLESLAYEGDTMITLAYDPDAGKYVLLNFTGSGSSWSLQGTIGNLPELSYSTPIALSGNTLLVGSSAEGAVYVFVRSGSTWSQQAKLMLTTDPSQLLVNGGFEVGLGNGNWKASSASPWQDCFGTAYSGFCSLAFTSYSREKATQNVNLSVHSLAAGDKIRLNGFYYKENTQIARVRLLISYANLPEDQKMITLQRATTDWQPIPELSATLKAVPTRVRVVIEGEGEYYDKNLYFDDITLVKVDTTTNRNAELVPLP